MFDSSISFNLKKGNTCFARTINSDTTPSWHQLKKTAGY